MLRLLLDGTEVDLYENESVNLTLQFADVQNINSSTGSFSQTFRLPATDNNLDFFGPIDKVSGVDVKNPKERIPAELVSGTTPILRGYVQIKAIYLQKEKYADIEVVFFAGAVDLRSQLAGKMLTDLNLSTYDHTLSYANVTGSWVGVGIAPEIRYGLIDKGFNWSFPDSPPWTEDEPLEQGELTPFIQVKKVFDAIMDGAGFTYDSDFFDTTGEGNFDRIYMPIYNGAVSPLSDDDQQATVRVALDADYTSGTLATLRLSDQATGAVDDDDNWNNTSYRFVAPYTGLFSVTVVYSYAHAVTGSCNIYIYKNGTQLLEVPTPSHIAYNATYNTQIVLESGDYLELKGQINTLHYYTL